MSVWDYVMPHRLLINKSLRKEAEGLRARVDAYQIEYDRRVEECKEEIERVEAERQEKLLQFRDSLEEELQGERSFLESVAQDITSYADAYLHRNCLFQMRDIKRKQIEILQEDNDFLSNQMVLIGEEIDNLRDRQNELTSFTDVKDIIRLTSLSGYEINFGEGDDAKDLLEKVSQAISNCEASQDTERFALVRLKGIIQERSEYLPTIKYIAWVIQQKIQFSKQLADKRTSVRAEQEAVQQEIKQIEDNISSITETLEDIARKVRYYWAKPITYLNADICYAYIELKEERERLRSDAPALKRERKELVDKKRSAISDIRDKKSRRRDVGSELRSMSDSHSSDQWRWDSLQSERRSLSSDIDGLSSDIDRSSSKIDALSAEIESLESAVKSSEATISSKKEARKKWNEKRVHIIKVLKHYDMNFRSDRRIAEKDETDIITLRLEEIQQIREEGAVEAQEVYKREYEEIIRLHDERVSDYEGRRQELNKKYKEAEAVYLKCEQRVSLAKKHLESSKESDDRFVLVKFFSESAAVTAAKGELEKSLAALAKAQETKKSVKLLIDELEEEAEAEEKAFDEEVNNCKPRYLRPTAAEQNEEKKLLLRLDDMNQQRKEGGHES